MERSLLSSSLFGTMAEHAKKTEEKIFSARYSTSDRTVFDEDVDLKIILMCRSSINNLEIYLNEDTDIDPLIKMAVMHYQFEAIHPFFDGNGRAGRILIVLYLVSQGLLDLPVLFLSKYIIEHKSDYYRSIREVTEIGAWENWVMYMLNGRRNSSLHSAKN